MLKGGRLEQAILPEAQVTDFRQANPGLTRGLDQATGILSMICLVAMVLGAIGVAMAMRAHLAQRMDILAVMKSIGARSSDILRIYVLQTTLLGLAGGLLGVVLGIGVEELLPHCSEDASADHRRHLHSGICRSAYGITDDAALLSAAAVTDP